MFTYIHIYVYNSLMLNSKEINMTNKDLIKYYEAKLALLDLNEANGKKYPANYRMGMEKNLKQLKSQNQKVA